MYYPVGKLQNHDYMFYEANLHQILLWVQNRNTPYHWQHTQSMTEMLLRFAKRLMNTEGEKLDYEVKYRVLRFIQENEKAFDYWQWMEQYVGGRTNTIPLTPKEIAKKFSQYNKNYYNGSTFCKPTLHAVCDDFLSFFGLDLVITKFPKKEGVKQLGSACLETFIIQIGKTPKTQQDLFTVFHELAHILLGHSGNTVQNENEANDFANAIFKEIYGKPFFGERKKRKIQPFLEKHYAPSPAAR